MYQRTQRIKAVRDELCASLNEWPRELCHLLAEYEAPFDFHWQDDKLDGIAIEKEGSRISVIGNNDTLRESDSKSLALAIERTNAMFGPRMEMTAEKACDERGEMCFVRVRTIETLAESTGEWEVVVSPNRVTLVFGFEYPDTRLFSNIGIQGIYLGSGCHAGLWNIEPQASDVGELTVKSFDSRRVRSGTHEELAHIRFSANLQTGHIAVQTNFGSYGLHLPAHLLSQARFLAYVWGPQVLVDIRSFTHPQSINEHL
jgi:hypothetical protein